MDGAPAREAGTAQAGGDAHPLPGGTAAPAPEAAAGQDVARKSEPGSHQVPFSNTGVRSVYAQLRKRAVLGAAAAASTAPLSKGAPVVPESFQEDIEIGSTTAEDLKNLFVLGAADGGSTLMLDAHVRTAAQPAAAVAALPLSDEEDAQQADAPVHKPSAPGVPPAAAPPQPKTPPSPQSKRGRGKTSWVHVRALAKVGPCAASAPA